MRPGGAGDLVGAFDVDLVNQVPVGVFHLVEGLVAQDAGVVHHHIDAAEGVQGALHDLLAVGHRVMVGHRGAARLADFRHHLVRRRGVGAFAVGAAAQVVDHHLGTMLGEQQGMGTTQAAAGPGDDYNLILKTDGVAHAALPRQINNAPSVQQARPGHNRYEPC